MTQYRVQLARENRQWAEAEQLQRLQVEETRQQATPFLDNPSVDEERNVIRTLSVSLHELGEIEQTDCVKAYEESLILNEQIDDQVGAATCALNLGNDYKNLSTIRNLEQAAHWYQWALELTSENDR